MEKDTTLTSVKIRTDLFEDFKIECVRKKFNLSKLVNRAMFLYLTDEEFQRKLHNQTNLNK